jgi:hypothetical protein
MSACRKRVRCILDDPDGARVRGRRALLQQQAQLPWLAWLVLLPLCIGLVMLRWRGAALFALASGLLWAAVCAHWRMADWLSPELEFDVESAARKLR